MRPASKTRMRSRCEIVERRCATTITVLPRATSSSDGTHAELLWQRGAYRALWDAQSDGFLPEGSNGDRAAAADTGDEPASLIDAPAGDDAGHDVKPGFAYLN